MREELIRRVLALSDEQFELFIALLKQEGILEETDD